MDSKKIRPTENQLDGILFDFSEENIDPLENLNIHEGYKKTPKQEKNPGKAVKPSRE